MSMAACHNKGGDCQTEALGPTPRAAATHTVALARSDPTILILCKPDLHSTGKS